MAKRSTKSDYKTEQTEKVVFYLGSDHAGFELKEKVRAWFESINQPYLDLGNKRLEKGDDYPDFAKKVALKQQASNNSRNKKRPKTFGLLFCGSAEGVCIVANKFKGIRAVNPSSLIQTELSRFHEDANVLCLAGGKSKTPQPSVSLSKAKKMIKLFASTIPSGEARHLRRQNKIKLIESQNFKK